MERSRKLTLTDWTKANDALNLHFEGNKSKLTKHLDMSRTTVTNFFNKKPVREGEFRKICLALRLNWKEVSEVEAIAIQETVEVANEEDSIEEIRSRCRQKMISQYNSIRLLNQTEITVDQLYVDVWLLKRPTQTLQPGTKMWELFDLRNDRLGLGDRDIRADGMEIANRRNRLLILGKPGVGKTTFLKHLAVDCSKEKFQSDLIPVLIELRQIRSRDWKLLDAIAEQLELSPQQTEKLLAQEQLLILMDGLDEVPSIAFRGDVQSQICDLAQNPKHAKNRFVLTCRTQIITGEMPQGFTAVEVADFKPEQVQRFVENWFRTSGLAKNEVEQRWQAFSDTIDKNPALKELTVTPVLLSLMCWVFEDAGELPVQAASLYDKGIDLLLKRWNERKKISEWEMGNEIYHALTLQQKKQMLTKIAAWKFEHPENFVLFEQEVLTQQISEILRLDKLEGGEAVLRAIEAQHGLLVERADRLWSFSHLTFQEHFTVQWLTQLSPEQLASKIAEHQWQERVKQLFKFQSSDKLLKLIKQAIDSSISQDAKLQEFLAWLLTKTETFQTKYKLAAIRAFYLDLTLDLACTVHRALDRAVDLNLDCTLSFTIDHDLTHVLDLSTDCVFDSTRLLKCDFNLILDLALTRDLARATSGVLARDLGLAHHRILALPPNLPINSVLLDKLKRLRLQVLEHSAQSWNSLQQWWHGNSQVWIAELRQVMIEHRNTGHNWDFTKSQEKSLQRYYDANKFLVELLKSDMVTDTVCREIEDNLLLPIAELKRRSPTQYS